MADKAVEFIEANTSNPFLLYYCPITAHTGKNAFDAAAGTTFHGPPAYIQKYIDKGLSGSDDMDKLARLYASLEFLDVQLGRIFQTLENEGIADDTIIVYISDNGPATSGNLKPGFTAWDTIRSPDGVVGNKNHIWENGIRSYCLIQSRCLFRRCGFQMW
jgi:arylsulfatase A-like enzyme